MKYKSNHNVVYSCKYHVVWCPKYRRPVLISLHTWSFYRLAQFIEYKARLAGIKVEYVNPAYTSQRCPVCGNVHHANDRNYTCSCGFHIHRDLLGAMNICNSTEYVGDNNIRHTA